MITQDTIILDKKYTLKHNNAALIEYQKIMTGKEDIVMAENALYLFWSGLKANNALPFDYEAFNNEVNNSDVLVAEIYEYVGKIALAARELNAIQVEIEGEETDEKKHTALRRFIGRFRWKRL